MHLILGANGHVGSATARALLEAGEPVTVILRDESKAAPWRAKGARAAVADVFDAPALRRAFQGGDRLFLLNPPAPPSTATAARERASLASILSALEGSGLRKIVAESTYGAQPGDRLGDLGVLFEMECALAAQPIPFAVIRAAYYLSNWDQSLPTARQGGVVHGLFPTAFRLPMVAPRDLGAVAARLLREDAVCTGVHHVEGPARWSPADVAAAFAAALGRPVRAVETPRAEWKQALEKMGFSEPAAESFCAMTAATLAAKNFPEPDVRGPTTLQQYVDDLVAAQPAKR